MVFLVTKELNLVYLMQNILFLNLHHVNLLCESMETNGKYQY